MTVVLPPILHIQYLLFPSKLHEAVFMVQYSHHLHSYVVFDSSE